MKTNGLRINRHPRVSPVIAPFVMVMRSDLEPAYAALVGPFTDEDAAVKFGEKWQAACGDNPCWQVLNCRTDFQVMQVRPEDVLL